VLADAWKVIVATSIMFFADHLHNDLERIQVRTLVAGHGCEHAALLGALGSKDCRNALT
jgi:hypothetical protein